MVDLLGDRQRKLNLELRSFRSEPRFRFACFAPYSNGACCAPLVYYIQSREKLKACSLILFSAFVTDL